jgi:hypothetical protein
VRQLAEFKATNNPSSGGLWWLISSLWSLVFYSCVFFILANIMLGVKRLVDMPGISIEEAIPTKDAWVTEVTRLRSLVNKYLAV